MTNPWFGLPALSERIYFCYFKPEQLLFHCHCIYFERYGERETSFILRITRQMSATVGSRLRQNQELSQDCSLGWQRSKYLPQHLLPLQHENWQIVGISISDTQAYTLKSVLTILPKGLHSLTVFFFCNNPKKQIKIVFSKTKI